jgi:hypothetical protein
MGVEVSSRELRYLYFFLSRSTKFKKYKIAVLFINIGTDRTKEKMSEDLKLPSITYTFTIFIIIMKDTIIAC